MNCSESQRLRTLLSRLLLELHHRGNVSGLGAGLSPSMGMGVVPNPSVGREVTSIKGDDAYLYILFIMILNACLAGGLILVYNLSRKLVEAKDEPSQACAEHQWVASGTLAAADAETATGSPAEGRHKLAPRGLSSLTQGTEGV
ncbi:potassium voltage-gated channel subfamily E regulatory beta subunit 5 [Pteropus vampyrus]|uniref:Potassium voltage-gated channel subfamily E regulatory beta subunit 5 n=2 Tax=Pteropus vampyrus TaxID=132908 RepID=A0A6P3RE54_PTEVA|nr:potassium voltage-gated channel subfamily E regulatory beta subunit 5 [Pteropus vampyrus]